jgi:hypothetical protein
MGQSHGALPNGQTGIEIIDGVEIICDKWAATQCNPAPAPLIAPDTGVGEAPVNAASVENNSTPPQINPAEGNYTQPNTTAPAANPEVTVGGGPNLNPMGL